MRIYKNTRKRWFLLRWPCMYVAIDFTNLIVGGTPNTFPTLGSTLMKFKISYYFLEMKHPVALEGADLTPYNTSWIWSGLDFKPMKMLLSHKNIVAGTYMFAIRTCIATVKLWSTHLNA